MAPDGCLLNRILPHACMDMDMNMNMNMNIYQVMHSLTLPSSLLLSRPLSSRLLLSRLIPSPKRDLT